jgi:hypothetical protein
MTGAGAGGVSRETAQQMAELGSALAAGGLRVQVNSTRGVLDITAELDWPQGKPVEVIADEDGYIEIRYWNPPGATAAGITAVISRALAAITGPS